MQLSPRAASASTFTRRNATTTYMSLNPTMTTRSAWWRRKIPCRAPCGACTEPSTIGVRNCPDVRGSRQCVQEQRSQLRSCAPETIGAPTGSARLGSARATATWILRGAPRLPAELPGDNFCDSACDVEECGFDLGDCTRPDPMPAKSAEGKEGVVWARHEECDVGDVRPCACTLPTEWPLLSPDLAGLGPASMKTWELYDSSETADALPERLTYASAAGRSPRCRWSPSPEGGGRRPRQQFASPGRRRALRRVRGIGTCSHEEVKKKKVKKCKRHLKKVGKKAECVTADEFHYTGLAGRGCVEGRLQEGGEEDEKSCDCALSPREDHPDHWVPDLLDRFTHDPNPCEGAKPKDVVDDAADVEVGRIENYFDNRGAEMIDTGYQAMLPQAGMDVTKDGWYATLLIPPRHHGADHGRLREGRPPLCPVNALAPRHEHRWRASTTRAATARTTVRAPGLNRTTPTGHGPNGSPNDAGDLAGRRLPATAPCRARAGCATTTTRSRTPRRPSTTGSTARTCTSATRTRSTGPTLPSASAARIGTKGAARAVPVPVLRRRVLQRRVVCGHHLGRQRRPLRPDQHAQRERRRRAGPVHDHQPGRPAYQHDKLFYGVDGPGPLVGRRHLHRLTTGTSRDNEVCSMFADHAVDRTATSSGALVDDVPHMLEQADDMSDVHPPARASSSPTSSRPTRSTAASRRDVKPERLSSGVDHILNPPTMIPMRCERVRENPPPSTDQHLRVYHGIVHEAE